MGRDKAWLPHAGRPLIQQALDTARELGAARLFISGRPGADYSSLACPVLHDLEPGFGPLGGIERGLRACSAPLLLVLAVDMPKITPPFLRRLLARCDILTGSIPALNGELEPLAAVYPRRCHAFAVQALASSRPAVRDFARACLRQRALRTFEVTPADKEQFTNWNSPGDAGLVTSPSR
jgi:molybdopterin-guanine dinucleotide biosynthesis protein A